MFLEMHPCLEHIIVCVADNEQLAFRIIDLQAKGGQRLAHVLNFNFRIWHASTSIWHMSEALETRSSHIQMKKLITYKSQYYYLMKLGICFFIFIC